MTRHIPTAFFAVSGAVLIAFAICLATSASAAPPPPAAGAQIDFGKAWVPQGPAPMINGQTEGIGGPTPNPINGAIHTVVAHPANAGTVHCGGVNGGIWRTTNGTAAAPTWTLTTPAVGGQAIGVIEYDPTDAANNRMIAAHGYMSSFGQGGITNVNGVLLSTNNGVTWTTVLDPLVVGENIICAQRRGATLLAGSNGFFVGTGRLMRSIDSGATWTTISGGAGTGLPAGAAGDLQGDGAVLTRMYCAMLGVGIFRSDDSGATWVNVSAGDATLTAVVAAGTNNNTKLAVGPGGRLWVAAVTTGQLAYVGYSDNPAAGAPTWTAMNLPLTTEGGGVGIHPRAKPGGQGSLHLSFKADPVDVNTCYVGGDRQPSPFINDIGAADFSGRLFRGDSSVAPIAAGLPFSPQWGHLTHVANLGFAGGGTANNTSPHADSRDMAFDANGNLIEVDDAGIYRRTSPIDNTGDWTGMFGNGTLQVTEAHDVAYDTVSDILMIGNQDTGSAQQTATGSLLWTQIPSIQNFSGTDFFKADGGDVNVDAVNPAGGSTRYQSIQNLGLWSRRSYTGAGVFIAEALPTLIGPGIAPQFKTPVELNNITPTRLIIGGATDAFESMDQGDNIVALGLGGVNRPGGIAYGAAGNADATYVGVGGTVFVRQAAAGPFAATLPGGTVRDLAIDPANGANCAGVDSNQVFWTVNAGTLWTDITGDLAAIAGNTDIRTVTYVPVPGAGPDGIIIGSQNGVFGTLLNNLGVWFQVGTGMPHSRVWELDYDATDDLLVATTLGRGVWTTPMLTVPSDATPPTLTCTLARTIGWPPFGGLVPVGLMVTATDNQPPDPIVTVTVYSDEADPAGPFSPDATGTMPADTRLRLQRDYPWGGPAFAGDAAGRVYLVRADAFDAAGNVTTDCKSMIVPTLPYGMLIMMLQAQAMAGEAACEAIPAVGGVATPDPAGYTQALCYTAP